MNSSLQLRQFGATACWCWARIFFLLLSIILPVTCSALEIQRVQTCSGIVLRLRVGFDLSSEGGILEEGLRIANFTRRKKLVIYVTGECNSVCADIFFAGAKRYLGAESKVGVHSVSNDRDIEDTGSKLLTIKLARLWAEQGIPNSAIGKMVTTRPETITYLDRADLSALDASGGDPFAYKGNKSSEAGQPQHQSCANQLDIH